jgi:Fe-S cluster assembly protein SufD
MSSTPTIAPQKAELERKLLTHFREFEARLNGETKSGFHQIRTQAIQQFEKSGFPTKKNEDWKYTGLDSLLAIDWKESQADFSGLTKEDIRPFLPENLEANLLVFINGQYASHLSQIIEEEEGIVIKPFSAALKEDKELLGQYYGKYASPEFSGFAALNTAFARNGVFIHVPARKIVKETVHCLYLSGYGQPDTMSHIRNLIVLEEGAILNCIESTASFENNSSFTNVVSELVLAERAILNYYKIQLENEKAFQVNYTQVHQQRESLCNNATVTFGGQLVRNDLNYCLNDKQCESHLYGLYISSGDQHIDNHTFVDHAKPNCFSNEFYKGIMMDRSVAVFNGKIMVRPDAQKTNAYQSNKNILLSNEAKINTKPQLEIFADDVKCSHGATTGQLDEDAIFYLQARGIGQEEAKAMLTFAFAEDVLENIKLEPLKDYLDNRLREKLNR